MYGICEYPETIGHIRIHHLVQVVMHPPVDDHTFKITKTHIIRDVYPEVFIDMRIFYDLDARVPVSAHEGCVAILLCKQIVMDRLMEVRIVAVQSGRDEWRGHVIYDDRITPPLCLCSLTNIVNDVDVRIRKVLYQCFRP